MSSIKGNVRWIATSLSKIYAVSIVPQGKHFRIAVATVDSVTGTVINLHQLDAALASDADLQIIGSHSSVPLALWNEKGKIKANILGSKSVTTLPTEVQFADSWLTIERVHILLGACSTFKYFLATLPRLLHGLDILMGPSLPHRSLKRDYQHGVFSPEESKRDILSCSS